MKKYIVLLFFVLFTITLVNPVLAAKGIIKDTGNGGSAGSITVSDLGITDVGTLPSSKWYFFKEWGRGFERFFTFNLVKKTELELRITNEKAAEALKVQLDNPVDAPELAIALENYTKAAERLQARLAKLKETSENPNVGKLLEKLNEQTLKHAILFNQFAVRDPNLLEQRDNHLQGAVDVVQKKIQEIVVTAVQKDKNIEQKAADQIARADIAIHELESELAKLKSGFIYSSQTQSARFAINEPSVPNNKRAINTKGTGAVARTTNEPGAPDEKTGQVRLDPTPARISTNTTIERQTPKRDFGDRMKAGLETAGGILAKAKEHISQTQALIADSKFGEAFGQARSAEVLARNGLRIVVVLNNELQGARKGSDADAPRIEDTNSAMPIVPSTSKAGEKIVPEAEKRVFPETNNNSLPAAKNTSGYTFTITGRVMDNTIDPSGMTDGVQMAGVVIRAIGPKTVTTQTRTDGSYTLSFANAPVGTYDVCVTPPSGYTANPPSGCENVVVRLRNDTTLDFFYGGGRASHATIYFDLRRKTESSSTGSDTLPQPTTQETCRQKGPTCNIIPDTNDCYCYDARNCETPDCVMR